VDRSVPTQRLDAGLSPLRTKGAILLETLDEERSITPVLEEICESIDVLARFGHSFSVLIVDDSSDTSIREISARCAQQWSIEISVLQGTGRGLGAAISQGLRHAIDKLQCEVVVNLDADGQHDARQIPDLLRIHLATNADLTIGSRWIRGGEAYGLGLLRTSISKLSSFLLRSTSVPWSIKDPTTSFRVYSKSAVSRCLRETLGYDGYAFIPMIAAVASAMGLKIVEVPIRFRPRIAGISKLKAKQMKDAIRDLPRIRARKKMIARRELFPFVGVKPIDGITHFDGYQATTVLEHLASSPRTARRWCGLFLSDLGPRVLEVGAGLGQNTRVMAKSGAHVTALEPDTQLFARLASDLDSDSAISVSNSSILNLIQDPPTAKFTSAVYINVLEHIEDDESELRQLSRILEPGGKVIIFSPALPFLYSSLDGNSSHYRRYTRREIGALLVRSGFEVERLEYHDQFGAFLYWLTYRLLRIRSAESSSVFVYDNVVLPISSVITRILGNRVIGKNILAIGRVSLTS
jgi:2-polyprenyl-3-methyl-5-hydroxy-6-metoxy-1,4-benzoquinol methylase